MPIPAWLAVVLTVAAVVGHAYVLMAVVNFLYGERISRAVLKPVRFLIGALVIGDPVLLVWLGRPAPHVALADALAGYAGPTVQVAVGVFVFFGLVVFPVVTVYRLRKAKPKAWLAERTETVDLWPIHGEELRGDGSWRWATHLPFNRVFRFDLTEMTLAVPGLPPAWDGLTIHVVSDLHFVGTPARRYFDELIRRMNDWPTPDVLVLAGDYVDTFTHHRWILPTLGRLKWREAALAILGNHDVHFRPARIRRRLTRLGCHVLGNRWKGMTI